MKQLTVVMMIGLTAVAVTGCRSDRLATGYVPQRLGSSDAERRGYYARAYTPEAAEAQMERLDRKPNLQR